MDDTPLTEQKRRTHENEQKSGGEFEFDATTIIKEQLRKFSDGERAMSPVVGIPVEFYTSNNPQPLHRIAWVQRQQEKAQRIIYDDRFTDAKKMVSDGRAKLLVSYGYNMYGKRMRDGRNFFDKPFNEDYEMFDWVPKWVSGSESKLYYKISYVWY